MLYFLKLTLNWKNNIKYFLNEHFYPGTHSMKNSINFIPVMFLIPELIKSYITAFTSLLAAENVL